MQPGPTMYLYRWKVEMNHLMRVGKIMTMLPRRPLERPLLKRLPLPRLKSLKSQPVTHIQTRSTAWQAVRSGRSLLMSMLPTLQMPSVAAMRTERTNCIFHESQVVRYHMLTRTGTVPMAIWKSVFYALAPPLRATASPPRSPRPRLRLPEVMVKPSTVTRTQVSSKSYHPITMDIANICQALR
jgi:hypothetical protein